MVTFDAGEVLYFASAAEFRAWLVTHAASEPAAWVGFYRKGTGRTGITYSEAVDEALCFGWIDGIVRRVDDVSYANRFTPRAPRSIWSTVNVARAEELIRQGRMTPAGLAAFAGRDPARAGLYSFEQDEATLAAAAEALFQANAAAWKFFQAQPAGYRKRAIWWVTSARRVDTRAHRLATLIADSAAGRRSTLYARARAAQPER